MRDREPANDHLFPGDEDTRFTSHGEVVVLFDVVFDSFRQSPLVDLGIHRQYVVDQDLLISCQGCRLAPFRF
ncbi:MAG: hypothetical protein O3B95_03880 [Chloroflexi bacterium]|nr:hypothetical protein [Chloroflexota bacterium]